MSVVDEPFITMKEAVLETRRDVKSIQETLINLATKTDFQDHEGRIKTLETTAITDAALKKDRVKIYRGAFAVVASFIGPIVAVGLSTGGIH